MNKSTGAGFFRTVDEMGRLVIPKEIRTEMGISKGDVVEVMRSGNEAIVRKLQHTSYLQDEAEACLRGLWKLQKIASAVCNLNSVIAVSSTELRDIVGKTISENAQAILCEGIVFTQTAENEIFLVSGENCTSISCAAPIFEKDKVSGLVALFSQSKNTGNEYFLYATLVSSILSSRLAGEWSTNEK